MTNLNNLEVNKEELKKSIKYACETIRRNIDNTIEVAFEQAKDLDSDDKIWVLNLFKKYGILPIGESIYDCPEMLYNYLKQCELPRYSVCYYADFLKYPIDEYSEEDRRNMIDEVWDYVGKHKIIGCINDW